MDPISNVDRLVLLLRQRLLESAKPLPGASTANSKNTARAPAHSVQALHAIEGLDDRQLKRALVQGILTDHFGNHAVNDAAFQHVIDRVTQALDADPNLGALFNRVASDLRASA